MELTDSRSYKIQVLRGLAIIAVVFIHNTPNGLAQVWCRPFLNFSVGCFLFLSGMLSNSQRRNPTKRIMKVIIPYVIWTLPYVIVRNIKQPGQIPASYLWNLITAGAVPIMYYIFVYCELVLLMPLIDRIARSKYKYLGFLISPLEIIFMRLIPLITGYQMNEYFKIVMSISCLGWFTYYYLGYLLGNKIIQLQISTPGLLLIGGGGIVLQILEGYWYFLLGETNCGTQLKLSAIFTGAIFSMATFRFINSERKCSTDVLYLLGNYSFGIYFSHLAVMGVLEYIPFYLRYVIYPFNAIVTIGITFVCVLIGKKVLGKYSKYFAL